MSKLFIELTLSQTQVNALIGVLENEIEALRGEVELTGSVTKTSAMMFLARLQNKLVKAKNS